MARDVQFVYLRITTITRRPDYVWNYRCDAWRTLHCTGESIQCDLRECSEDSSTCSLVEYVSSSLAPSAAHVWSLVSVLSSVFSFNWHFRLVKLLVIFLWRFSSHLFVSHSLTKSLRTKCVCFRNLETIKVICLNESYTALLIRLFFSFLLLILLTRSIIRSMCTLISSSLTSFRIFSWSSRISHITQSKIGSWRHENGKTEKQGIGCQFENRKMDWRNSWLPTWVMGILLFFYIWLGRWAESIQIQTMYILRGLSISHSHTLTVISYSVQCPLSSGYGCWCLWRHMTLPEILTSHWPHVA